MRRGKERNRNGLLPIVIVLVSVISYFQTYLDLDSDRSSSVRGSIVEEDYEVDDISSGDATPTEESGDEKHWNRQSKRV